MRFTNPSRKNEHGVTILIVGMTLLALVAMAALAIDVASLYEAKSEAQRTADAAALAAARVFVTSSFTSTTDSTITTGEVCAAANIQAGAAAQVNPIAGRPATIKNIQCNNANRQNPRVTVTAQTASAPTFFARIWGANANTITATATAEAYNASGQSQQIELTNVKPWLIPNCDPDDGSRPCANGYFVDSSGNLNGGATYIGEVLHMSRQVTGTVGGGGGTLQFYGLVYPTAPPPNSCPAACPSPVKQGDLYIDNIACVNSLKMYCGQKIGFGSSPSIQIEGTSPLTGQPTVEGTKCLIHSSGNGYTQGQDEFTSTVPVVINGGSNNPNPALRRPNISRSDSVVTAMLYDGHQMCMDSFPATGACNNPSPQPATVVGFLQLAVLETTGVGGGGTSQLLDAIVVNVVGCTPDAIAAGTGNAIAAQGSSPIVVRLVRKTTP